jgi:uncharacterized repeat protein (TIGR01451 family)
VHPYIAMAIFGGTSDAARYYPPYVPTSSAFDRTYVRSALADRGAHLVRFSSIGALLLVALLLALPQSALAQHKTYGVNDGFIFEINTNGTAASVVTLTTPGLKAALAQRPSDGLIFFMSTTSTFSNDSVFTWNPATPATPPVFIGRAGAGIEFLPRLEFSQGGTLYAFNYSANRLYTINQNTGAATPIGVAFSGRGGGAGGDMAFAPSGILYMMTRDTLYTVPLGGGAISLVGQVTGFAGAAAGMAFDAQGRLLVSNYNTPSSQIYVVPLTAGAAMPLPSSAGLQVGDLGSVLAVDLRISKSHLGSFSQGQTAGATYTITVRDSGNVATSGTVTMLDTLPAGLTPVSAAGAGWACPAPVGQVVTCTRADALASGNAYPAITLTVTVSGTAPASVTNTARVSGGAEPAGNPGLTGNDAAADVTAITGQPELTITKTHAGNFTVGVNGVYTLTVTNNGRAATAGTVTVTDNLPVGLTFVSGTGGTWACSAAGQLVTCTNAAVIAASGGTSAITLTVSVGAAAAPSVTNSASVSGGGEPAGSAGNNTSAGDLTTVVPTADLSITKTDGVVAVNQGASVTYTIVASNAGPNAVVAATVTDNFPAQLSGVTWTCAASAGSSCPASGAGNISAAVNLLSGGTATFTVTAPVTAGSGTITNVATITAPAGTNDPAGNNSGTDNNTVITPTADLAITKTDGVVAVNQGASLTYTIVASNAGPSGVVGATVTDNFPAQLSGVTWTCAASAGSSCPASGAGNISAAVNLLSGGTATFTVTAPVTGTGTITNVATITAPAGTNDPGGNNSGTDNNTVITPTANLAITKTDGVVAVNQGATLTYTIVASNAGPSGVVGATVNDAFPAQLSGMTWTCAASAGSSCPASGAGNLAAAVNLLSGGTATFTATGTVTAASGTITNTATITAPAGVNDPAGNNSATDNNTVITPTADLAITKTDGVTAVNQGASLTYTIVASNAGPSAVIGATVTDNFPAQLASVTWTCAASAGSSCPASGSGNLNASINLVSGGTATFTVTATVTAGSGTITNTATITAPAGTNDPAGNNAATDNNTVITPTADLAITKTDGLTGVNQGGTLTYTIVASNAGPSAVVGATVSDVFPAQLSPVTWTCAASAGSSCPPSGSGNLNASINLLSAGTATFTATGTVTAGSGTITNTATVTAPAGTNDPAGNNSATDNNTVITPTADLSITKTDGLTAVNQGATLTYTIVASNAGPSAVVGATVSDVFPAQLTSPTWTCAASAGSACPASGSGNLSASVNLLSGGTATFTATGTVTAGSGTISNTAGVTAPAGTNDPAGNNSATDNNTVITPTADLSITKTDGLTSVNQGATLTYTIVASNAGPSAVVGATVNDVFPAQLSSVTWTCAASAGSSCPASGSGNLSASVNLLSGGTATFTATATVTPGSGTITNTATITAPAGTNDPAGNNSATDNNTAITPTADLSITKTDGLTTVNQGASLTYTIVASNAGPSAVVGATVSDAFPGQLSVVNWTCAASAGSSCPASGAGNLAAAVNLLSGGTATFTATGTVTAGSGTITNTASVAAPAGVNDPAGNNSATDNNTVITPTSDLAITKTDGLTTVNQGASLTYTIVASNAGPSAVVGATVSDAFPGQLSVVNWTCAASAGSSCPASGAGNLAAAVNLLSGGTATFTATSTVTAGSGTIMNTATVTAPAGTNDPAGNNAATDNNTVITPTADLSITKTDGLTSVNQGAALTYTIVASNAGPSAVVGATVSDVFPAQLSSVTWTCAASGGSSCPASGSGNIGASVTLLSGGSATFTVTATASGAGTIANTATVTAPAGTNDPAGNNSATDNNTVITPTADLGITKASSGAVPGQAVTYTIAASNAGPTAVTGATVADVFPAALTGVSWTCAASAGSSCPASGTGNLNATVNILAGGTVTFTATGSLPSNATGTLANTATVTAPAGVNDPAGNNSATVSEVLGATADVQVTKGGPALPVVPGTNLVYTVVVTNTGPSDAVAVSVADPTPTGLTFVSNSGACVTAYPCALGTVAAGASRTITTTYNVPGAYSTPDPIVNTATATSTTADPAAGNNTAVASTSVAAPVADLTVTKTDGSGTAAPGTSISYTIVAGNAGPSTATGATVTDNFPPQITGVTWTCTAAGGAACPASGAGNLAALVDLPSGGTATFVATGTIAASATGTLVNTVAVTPPAGASDPTSANSTDVDTLVPSADLGLTKTGPANATPGTTVVYTLVVSNAGPSNAASVAVSDPTPAGLTFVSTSGACVTAFPCNLGTLAPGATRTITATFAVPSTYTTPDPIVNSATVTSPSSDPAGGNNTASTSATVAATADLSITKTDGVTSVNQGATLTYTIVASNTGPSAVTGATVSDLMPVQLGAATWTCVASVGSVCPVSGSGNVSAVVDLLSAGTATFTVTAAVTGTGTINNTATVTAPAGVNDPAGNNSATDNNTVITATADLSITKTDGVTAVNQGATLTYTIVASNAGPSAVTGATVTDNFPAQLSSVTWTCAASAGSSCPASGSGNLNASVNLLNGGTATFTATATVTGTGTISNTATVTAPAGTNDPAGNNGATDNNTVITPTAELSITKTDGVTAVNQGATITYTILASNAGPSAVSGATVTDNFPAQLGSVTWTCASSAGSSCPASGSGNLSVFVNLLSGGTATFTATATVTAASGTITNTATVTAPAGINDLAGNNSATDNDTQITATADLSIAKTDGVTSVSQGATLTYTVVASNAGPSAVTGATVTDNFPAQVASVTWTCAASAGSTCPASGSGNISASVDVLAGGTVTLTATATVTGTGTISNTATVTAPAGLNDPATPRSRRPRTCRSPRRTA